MSDEESSSEGTKYGVDRKDTFISVKNVKSNPKTFRSKLNKYQEHFSEDVLDKAYIVFTRIEYSQNRRKKQILKEFFCIYLALQEMGKPSEIKSLIKIFNAVNEDLNLTEGEAQKTINKYTSIKVGFISNGISLTAVSFIPGKVEQYKLSSEAAKEIISFAERILEKEPKLKNSLPNYLTEAIIKYYCEINNIEVKGQVINDTIKKLYKLVQSIDNEVEVKI